MTTLHHHSHHPHHNPRRLSVCPLHPNATPSTAFCASCLRDRLSGIDPSTLHEIPNPSLSAPRPDHLRRSKSYSSARREGGASRTSAEPRRRSCDSRGRSSTLSDLFTRDDDGTCLKVEALAGLMEEDEKELEGGEIRVAIGQPSDAPEENTAANSRFYDDVLEGDVELKTMKEFIDLELDSKKQPRREMSAFWEAASMFSKRLTKWRRKEKTKNATVRGGEGGHINDPAKVSGNQDNLGVRPRETQSEVGDYRLGRRSCDTDPRLSLDAGRFSLDSGRLSLDGGKLPIDNGRFSLDGGRISLEEPRASWDGYLIGGRSYGHHHNHQNQRFNSMVSFLEDVKVIDSMLKSRALVEEKLNVVDEEEEGRSPGGSIQTRDYYQDSAGPQRRRRSFDRSNSHRKGSLLEADDLKSLSNVKVSPATTELFYGAKLLISEGKLRGSDGKVPLGESCVKSIESVSVNAGHVDGDPRQGDKCKKWGKVRSIWGMIQKRNESRCTAEEKFEDGYLVGLQVPDSQKMNGSRVVGNCSGNARNSGAAAAEARGIGTRTKECVLQRNQSVKYCPGPGSIDSGLLRFYLTPLRSSRSSMPMKSSRIRKGANAVL